MTDDDLLVMNHRNIKRKSLGWSPTPGPYAGVAHRARQPPKTQLVLDEKGVLLVARRRCFRRRGAWSGHVRESVVL